MTNRNWRALVKNDWLNGEVENETVTTLVDVQVYQRTFRDIRNVRRLFGYSTTTAEDANCKFWDLPIASKKSVLQDSVHLVGKLLTHRYHEITTHLTNEEKVALYILASRLKSPCVAVEIGSFLGSSACFIALGLGHSGRLYCVDTWKNDAMDDPALTLRDTFSVFMENVRDFQRVIVPLRETPSMLRNHLKTELTFYLLIVTTLLRDVWVTGCHGANIWRRVPLWHFMT